VPPLTPSIIVSLLSHSTNYSADFLFIVMSPLSGTTTSNSTTCHHSRHAPRPRLGLSTLDRAPQLGSRALTWTRRVAFGRTVVLDHARRLRLRAPPSTTCADFDYARPLRLARPLRPRVPPLATHAPFDYASTLTTCATFDHACQQGPHSPTLTTRVDLDHACRPRQHTSTSTMRVGPRQSHVVAGAVAG